MSLSRQFDRQRDELTWRNNHTSNCPPGGMVKVTGMEIVGGTAVRYIGTQPDGDTTNALFYGINLDGLVGQNRDGNLTRHGAAVTLVADTSTSVYDRVGPGDGSWEADEGTTHIVSYADSGEFITIPAGGAGEIVRYGTVVSDGPHDEGSTDIEVDVDGEDGDYEQVSFLEDHGTGEDIRNGDRVQLVRAKNSTGDTVWNVALWPCHGQDASAASIVTTDKSWTFASPAGSSGTYYWGGFYQFHTTSFTPAGGTNVGTADAAYAAHALVVLGATSTDMVVRVTGTSITDAGVRTTSDTEDIDTSGGVSGDYYETSKKWIGRVSYTLQNGTGVTVDAGLSKYWDKLNTDFTVAGLEVTWLGGANDSGANIELLHHKTTGWTYSGGGGTPTPPTPIASLTSDYVTEYEVANGENGSWKRTNLSTLVEGSSVEGVMWRVTTSSNKAFELGNLLLTVY